jgi:hypothetical protein
MTFKYLTNPYPSKKFKFVTNSNDKVFCTRHGDFILTYNDIRNGICLIPISC